MFFCIFSMIVSTFGVFSKNFYHPGIMLQYFHNFFLEISKFLINLGFNLAYNFLSLLLSPKI